MEHKNTSKLIVALGRELPNEAIIEERPDPNEKISGDIDFNKFRIMEIKESEEKNS